MKMFTFSEQKFHLLHSKAQQRSWWCSVQPWFRLFRSLGWLLSLAEKTLFLSLPAGPPRLLVMHILYLGCGCIDLLGHCCCTCLGASENVLVGVGLMLPTDLLSVHCLCEHPAICVSTGDPQCPPGPWQSPLHVGGTQETFLDWRSPSLFSCLELASEFKHCHPLLLRDHLFKNIPVSDTDTNTLCEFKSSLGSSLGRVNIPVWFFFPWLFKYM